MVRSGGAIDVSANLILRELSVANIESIVSMSIHLKGIQHLGSTLVTRYLDQCRCSKGVSILVGMCFWGIENNFESLDV